jgi:hypothetical protein
MPDQPLSRSVKLLLLLNFVGFLLLVAGTAFIVWKITR